MAQKMKSPCIFSVSFISWWDWDSLLNEKMNVISKHIIRFINLIVGLILLIPLILMIEENLYPMANSSTENLWASSKDPLLSYSFISIILFIAFIFISSLISFAQKWYGYIFFGLGACAYSLAMLVCHFIGRFKYPMAAVCIGFFIFGIPGIISLIKGIFMMKYDD